LIRWFADLPIERKLRVVIMVPATVAFGIALAMHLATSLLHLRDDLLLRGSRVARVIGADVIAQAEAGDDAAAVSRAALPATWRSAERREIGAVIGWMGERGLRLWARSNQ